MISQGSVLSTINVIGIPHELGNLDDWQEEPLIKYLTEKILRSSINDVQLSEKASLLLNGALKRAWELDERYREKNNSWHVLEEVSRSMGKDNFDCALNFAAYLGFPCVGKKKIMD